MPERCGAQLHVVVLVEIQAGFSSGGRGDLDWIIDCIRPKVERKRVCERLAKFNIVTCYFRVGPNSLHIPCFSHPLRLRNSQALPPAPHGASTMATASHGCPYTIRRWHSLSLPSATSAVVRSCLMRPHRHPLSLVGPQRSIRFRPPVLIASTPSLLPLLVRRTGKFNKDETSPSSSPSSILPERAGATAADFSF